MPKTKRIGRSEQAAMTAAYTAELKRQAAAEAKRQARRVRLRSAGKVTRSVVFRGRAQLYPLGVLTALWVAGGMVSGRPVAGVVLLGLIAAGGVVFYLRRRLDRRAEQGYTLTLLAGGVVWLALAAAWGVTAVDGLLWTAGAVSALPWWWHHRDKGAPAPQPAQTSSVNDLWRQHIADKGGPLPDATLSPPERIKHGESYEGQLVPGRQTLDKALRLLPEISSGVRRPLDELVLEAHPSNDPSRFRLQVITRSPIKRTVLFDQPRHEHGRVLLGPHADGIGEATLRVYTQNSMWGGFLLGGVGSGKTRLLESIAITVLDMGDTVIFYIDGQDGASSPTLFHRATWAEGADGAKLVLGALERIMARRNKENRAHGWAGFTPSPQRPGILTIIDEAHLIFPAHAARWAEIVRTGRKVGLAVLAADQGADLAGVFGGQDVLRTALLAGNGLAMRVTSRIAGNLIPGLGLHPADLPVLPGYGYTVAAPGSDARTAPFRGRYLPDEQDKKADPSLAVPTMEDWFDRLPAVDIDAAAAKAAGPDFLERHERARREREALLAEIRGDEQAEDPVPEPAAPEESTDATTADRILELLAGYGEMERAQIIAELPSGTDLSTITKALRALVDRGQATKTGRGVYALARETAA